MTYAQINQLFDGENPVMFPQPDGTLRGGLLIRMSEQQGCGVQIPGEEDILWMRPDRFFHVGGGCFLGDSRPKLLSST